jgi:hypothetical protein
MRPGAICSFDTGEAEKVKRGGAEKRDRLLCLGCRRAYAIRPYIRWKKGDSNTGQVIQAGKLANALSGLFPKDSEEKRLLDAMLLAVPR